MSSPFRNDIQLHELVGLVPQVPNPEDCPWTVTILSPMKLACAVPSRVLLLCPDRPLLQVCFSYLFSIFIYSVWDQSLDFCLLRSTPTLVHPKARRIVLTTTVSQVVIRLTVLLIFKILIPITPSTANRYHHHVKQPNVTYFQLCSVLNPYRLFGE